ncbi:class I SAM-dependent methyltransferase (plasmid) [Rhizobium leguminosarum]|uniref:class I SAM-dependent methyltransferase n=1 Tax=Rhizobium leguminosarum TaxID=384 RepID=UPI001031C44D|nr:class I SAM-dependent methyltransferase [Rhizobium leguminosarum]TAZ47112.1 class I SAM-dependent methyltransferase [Rhizobium leguminosarum]
MSTVAPQTAEAMAAHWNDRAWRFNRHPSHLREADEWTAVFAASLGGQARDVIDLGSGTGACALLCAELGHRVTALDGSSAMLSLARENATDRGLETVSFVNKTMDEADLPSRSADIVTMRNVLWTLEKPAAAVQLAWRLLRPGGSLLISDGIWFAHRTNDSAETFGGHLPYFNGVPEPDALRLLEVTGFSDINSWSHLFSSHPYGAVYDDPNRFIDFFVLTARKTG